VRRYARRSNLHRSYIPKGDKANKRLLNENLLR
jgi:hypothetical protein